jgi:hypothetical protein
MKAHIGIWRTPAARVWRLVSGLPSGKREKRIFMVLEPQAFIDDSVTANGQGFYVLAGFVAPAAAWAQFSNDWQAVLDLKPKLEYFKMNEANLLLGQFAKERGWTEAKRNDRLIDFARVITKYAGIRIFASVRQSYFERYISHIPLTYRSLASDTPYIYLFTTLLVTVMVRSYRFGINEPCDFIFDNQSGIEEEIFSNWKTFRTVAHQAPSPRNLLGSRPRFENDQDFLPLQAADLFASQVRLSLERNTGRIIVPPNVILQQLLPIPDISQEMSAQDLSDMGEKVLKVQQTILKADPNAPLAHFAATARERRLIRKRVRKAKKASSSRGQPS